MQLHKHDVVMAAAAILDSYGIADLTMRRLARELDITPGALYWHFASKQQLLGAVADHLLRPVYAEAKFPVGAGWRCRISTVCSRMRDVLLAHTDGAELVSASFAAGQSSGISEVLASLTDTAAEAGLANEQATLAARTLLYYVLGATADEQSRRQWDAAGPTDPAAGFHFGLRLLIDGVAAQAAPRVPAVPSVPSVPAGADRVLDALVAVPPA